MRKKIIDIVWFTLKFIFLVVAVLYALITFVQSIIFCDYVNSDLNGNVSVRTSLLNATLFLNNTGTFLYRVPVLEDSSLHKEYLLNCGIGSKKHIKK